MNAGWLFWGGIGWILWTVGGFPLVLWIRARFFPRPIHCSPGTPAISIIVPAYNEARIIEKKLQNLLTQDYPPNKVEIIVASDGSDDETNGRVRQIKSPLIYLLELPRQGKISTLNTAFQAAHGDILVLSDADTLLSEGALKALMTPFGDENVGGVVGDFRYVMNVNEGIGERAYWDFDRWLKQKQSDGGNVTSATGQLFAVRKELFRPIPPVVTDDFFISVQAVAAHYRIVFAPNAIAYGEIAPTIEREFERKVRVISRGLNGVWQMRRLLNPLRYGFYALQLFSHKVMRRLFFIPMMMMMMGAFYLWQEGLFYQLALVAHVGLHSMAIVGWLLRETNVGRRRWLSIPLYIDMVQLACAVAFFALIFGRRYNTWQTRR